MYKLHLLLLLLSIFVFANPTYAVFTDEYRPVGKGYKQGDLIIRFKEDKDPSSIRQAAAERRKKSLTLIGQAINRLEEIRLRSQGEALPEEDLKELEQIERTLSVVDERSLISNYVLIKASPEIPFAKAKAQYENLDYVESVEPNLTMHAAAVDPYAQWALSKINVQGAWEIQEDSPNIKVAVVDTGIDYNHPDLINRATNGYDFSTCDLSNSAGCMTEKERDSDAMDNNGHGTHVAGIIGAEVDNGIGIAGVSQNVQLFAVKTLGEDGGGYLDDVIDGIKYAADQGVNVINLSLSADIRRGCSDPLLQDQSSMQTAIDYAYNKGIVMVVAAGNEAADAGEFTPANCNNVITVGATNQQDQRTSYSNYGSTVDIYAPGGDKSCASCEIWSTYLSSTGNEYVYLSGTSMATPHVAGVAALMLARVSSLTPGDVRGILVNSADPVAAGPRLNAAQALAAAQPPASDPTPTPTDAPPNTTATPTVTPNTTPTPIPFPENTPTPTRIDAACSASCPEGYPARSSGNANCDEAIDGDDYDIWKTQYDLYRQGQQLTGEERTADFDCSLNNSTSSGYVTLADFELWRKHSFVVNPGTACGTIEGASFNTITVSQIPDKPPVTNVAGNPDYNISMRGWEVVADARKEIYDMGVSTDPDDLAPQLYGLFLDNRIPQVSQTYQMYDWAWGEDGALGSRGDLYHSPEVTLLGATTTPGEEIKMPSSGYSIGENYEAMVLYADEDSITLTIKADDAIYEVIQHDVGDPTVLAGYVIHVEDICTEPRLLDLYNTSNLAGRSSLPALVEGQSFGRAKGTELKFSIRDTGSFMEPRNTQNWWRRSSE